eukprot:1148011-Pelagomonas_calceolata.AAC.6
MRSYVNRSVDGLSSRAALAVEAAAAWPSAAEQGACVVDALELVQSGACSLDDLLMVWLRSGEMHMQVMMDEDLLVVGCGAWLTVQEWCGCARARG